MNNLMESSSNELPESYEQVIEKLILILKAKFDYEVWPSSRQKNVAELLSLKIPQPPTQFKTHIQIKAKTNQEISILISAVGSVQNGEFDYKKMEHHAAACNKKSFTQSFKLFWVEKNRNFSIFKSIQLEMITREKQLFVSKEFFSNIIQELLNTLHSCINEVVGYQEQGSINRQMKSNANPVALKKKIQTLEYFKYKFEQNRHFREKSTKSYNFYGSAYANYEELMMYYEKRRLGEEQIEIEFKDISKSAEKEEAEKNFEKIIDAFHRHENEKEKESKNKESKEQVLNAIKLYETKVVPKAENIKKFSHIIEIEANYGIIFSVNGQTNKSVENNPLAMSERIERFNLIKKFKCQGCHGESPEATQENRDIFENEKEILLILKPHFDSSICPFYVEEYESKNHISCIYSKKMPMDPITKFYKEIERTTNILKCIYNILKFLTEVSEGIYFLDTHKIIHRDLKPNNIMLDENKGARIIDFGSACPIYGSTHSLDPKLYAILRSTHGYYFPYASLPSPLKSIFQKDEYYQHSSFDVYSLGAIAEAMLEPYVLEAERIGIYEELTDSIHYFVKKCKDMQPDDRLIPFETSLFLRFLASAFQLLIRKTESA